MKKVMLIFAASMLLMACSKDKGIPSDPRAAFVSEYQSNEEHPMYGVVRDEYGSTDSTFTIPAGGKLMVSLAENTDSLVMNVEEIVDDAVTAILAGLGVPVNVEFAEKVLANLSGTNEFVFEDWPIKISYAGLPHQGLLSGQGKLNGTRLSLEYEIVLILVGTPASPDDAVYLFGEVVLDKK